MKGLQVLTSLENCKISVHSWEFFLLANSYAYMFFLGSRADEANLGSLAHGRWMLSIPVLSFTVLRLHDDMISDGTIPTFDPDSDADSLKLPDSDSCINV